MFNINEQCYQNISEVLRPSLSYRGRPCTCGFGIWGKIRCGLRFFSVFLCGFEVFGPPLRPPLSASKQSLQLTVANLHCQLS